MSALILLVILAMINLLIPPKEDSMLKQLTHTIEYKHTIYIQIDRNDLENNNQINFILIKCKKRNIKLAFSK